MRIEIFGEQKTKEETVVRLALRHGVDGGITLRAVDEDGGDLWCGNLLFVNPDGTFTLAHAVSPNLGLPLDDGQIAFRAEEGETV